MFYIGPQRCNVISSLLVLNTVAGCVLYFNCYLYWYLAEGKISYLAVLCVLWLKVDYWFFTTAFIEPGIIPKQIDTDVDQS